MEFTYSLVLIKPDISSSSKKVQAVLNTFVENNLELVQTQTFNAIDTNGSREAQETRLRDHYVEHAHQEWFPDLIDFMMSGPIIVWLFRSRDNAVLKARNLLGEVNGEGLRGQFGSSLRQNAIHVSDSYTAALREYRIWMTDSINPAFERVMTSNASSEASRKLQSSSSVNDTGRRLTNSISRDKVSDLKIV